MFTPSQTLGCQSRLREAFTVSLNGFALPIIVDWTGQRETDFDSYMHGCSAWYVKDVQSLDGEGKKVGHKIGISHSCRLRHLAWLLPGRCWSRDDLMSTHRPSSTAWRERRPQGPRAGYVAAFVHVAALHYNHHLGLLSQEKINGMLHGCWGRHAQRCSSRHRKKRRIQLKRGNDIHPFPVKWQQLEKFL